LSLRLCVPAPPATAGGWPHLSAFQAKALAQELAALSGIEPKLLLAESIRVLGLNAEKVGQLNITSEILAGLLNAPTSNQGTDSSYRDR
jgi:hypothetical protein